MTVADSISIFGGFLKLALLAGTVFCAGLVMVSYRAPSSPVRPRVDLQDPLHSAKLWAVWVGGIAFGLIVRAAIPFFEILSEASAEVGDWFLSHLNREAQ